MFPQLGLTKELRDKMKMESTADNLALDVIRKITETQKLRKDVPVPREVAEGSITVSHVPSKGLYLFVKYNNIIHHVQLTEGKP